MSVNTKKSFIITLGLLFAIALLFWTQSRFPALDQKAQMGQRTHISALAFDIVYPLSPDQGFIQRVFYSSINWAYTNWKGMSFGLAFAAAFLSLLSFITFNRPRHSNNWFNSFKGSLLGAPLGVCANCSTPIAFGMYQGGLPVATALSVLSSAPTLNFIVITMSLSLLPFEVVVIKYAMVLVYLWIILPLLLKYLLPTPETGFQYSGLRTFPDQDAGGMKSFPLSDVSNSDYGIGQINTLESKYGWMSALSISLGRFLNQLWFITKATLPFMILAGFLGALLAEFVPLDMLSVLPLTVGGLLLVSLLATLFPVPIAFDVIISVALLSMGVSVAYVGTVFFTLGILSIYPAMVIARDLSLKLSLSLMLAVVSLGVISGELTQYFNAQKHQNKTLEIHHYLKAEQSRSLVRHAARLCHRLGEPRQYQCFEQFVKHQLASQFSLDACAYLEDALEYRRQCESTFYYLEVSELAQARQSIETCAVLPTDYRLQCEYDLAFKTAVDQQNLSRCDVLESEDTRRQCQNDALILNLELYDSEQSCQSLGSAIRVQSCLSEMKVLREQQKLISQNDLKACLSLNNAKMQQYCQGVIMVNSLEQGASVDLCQEISEVFLQQRCVAFHRYFEILRKEVPDGCVELNDKSLRSRCQMETIQAELTRDIQTLKFNVIDTSLGNLQWPNKSLPRKPLVHPAENKSGRNSFDKNLFEHVVTLDKVTVESKSFTPKSHSGDKKFQRIPAKSIGLHAPPPMRVSELFEPFAYGRGISSGDFNQDDWPDLALAMSDRVRIYQNTGGEFELVSELITEQGLNPFLLAFADLNNDHWPDLFVSYYGGNNRIYMNRSGVYAIDDFVKLTPGQSNLTMAAGFADPDQDGDLDIILGSWSFGDLRNFRPVYAENYFAENISKINADKPSFRLTPLPGPRGETLSVLLSDLDGDGRAELMVGNDRDRPDLLYRWKESGYRLLGEDPKLPGLSAFNTMSMDSADINNDLKLDFFAADMSFAGGEGTRYCQLPGIENISECERIVEAEQALANGEITWCKQLKNPEHVRDCLTSHLIKLANESEKMEFCEDISPHDLTAKQLCQNAATKLPPKAKISLSRYLASEQKNVLMLSDKTSGGFKSAAEIMGVELSFWSWNAKFADLDNDGWQDIYIGNGYLFESRGRHLHSNVFFHNVAGQYFDQAEKEFGLVDYLNTPSFTYLDFDQDGDLDIISNRFGASPGVFVNHAQAESIIFSLNDEVKNSSVIGSKVIIRYGTDKQSSQMREIKLSGGFLSFDLPIAHFGLDQNIEIKQLEIEWADGQLTRFEQVFEADKLYRVTRK